jgi:N6-L-threonylcarbamoyladenine synthase
MDDAHDLPISRLGRESLDFSFSGLKTAVLYAARGVPGRDGSYSIHRREQAELLEEALSV